MEDSTGKKKIYLQEVATGNNFCYDYSYCSFQFFVKGGLKV